MKRTILNYLKTWVASPGRKPLILRGARQVGKTWVARFFAELNHLNCVELNFEKQPNLSALFASNDPFTIIRLLEAQLSVRIDPSHTLLFLDEIQVVPELLAKLRWFAEEMPELAVIAAGSLLDFTLAEHSFSMPVGRISYCHLEPLSFEEFLLALGKEKLYEFLTQLTWAEGIPTIIHEQLLDLFNEYLIVGGMPAAVLSWVKERSLSSVNQIHHDLLTTYRDDFAKYAGRLPIQRLNEVMLSIPKMLGEKFVYSRVNPDIQSGSIKQALSLLSQARVCHIVSCSSGNGVPLAAETKDKMFKAILLDVGLVSAALGLKLISLESDDNLVNQGGLTEQVVGQLLRTVGPFYIEPTLYYWARQEPGSSAEIDYLLQHHEKVIPVEVKSGSTGSLKSLHLFMVLKKLPLAVRINADLPSRTQVTAKTHLASEANYELLSLPLYLIGQLPRLIDQAIL